MGIISLFYTIVSCKVSTYLTGQFVKGAQTHHKHCYSSTDYNRGDATMLSSNQCCWHRMSKPIVQQLNSESGHDRVCCRGSGNDFLSYLTTASTPARERLANNNCRCYFKVFLHIFITLRSKCHKKPIKTNKPRET